MESRPWHRHYDPGVPPELEFEDVDLVGLLERSAERYPDRTALVFLQRRMSYRELKDKVDRLATGLEQLGVGKDSRVAIQLPNLPQTVIAFYATLSVGAQAVMTNPMYMPREIEHQWHDAGCTTAITTDFLYADKLRPIRETLPITNYVVTSIPDLLPLPWRWLAPLVLKKKQPRAVAPIPADPGVHRFRDLLRRAPSPRRVAHDLDDIAILQYTGGTTGVSKGAMLTHRNIACNVQQLRTWLTGVEEGAEVVLAALPYFHVFGLTVCMNMSVACAATAVVIPDPRDMQGLIGSIVTERVSVLPAVPAMFLAINTWPDVDTLDLTCVKGCFSGSAPLPQDTAARFTELTGATIIEGFGLTETSPVTHCNPFGGLKKPGSIGIPVSNTDARVVDANDGAIEKSPGEDGELLLAGPQVMAGYWGRADETAATLIDGWLYTGDLATMDEDGYFRIVGRKKDMIVAGGYNIYPDEIDDVITEHPDVHECCAIGVPDSRRGESVKVFVVKRPGAVLSGEDIRGWCRDRLAAYKIPRHIEFRDDLPRSTMMKVLRRVLRDEELATRAAQAEPGGPNPGGNGDTSPEAL